jgi:hypothetical protein
MGVPLIGMYLMGVHVISMFLMGIHLISVPLMGVYLMGVHFKGAPFMGVPHACISHKAYVHVRVVLRILRHSALSNRMCWWVQFACRLCLPRVIPFLQCGLQLLRAADRCT